MERVMSKYEMANEVSGLGKTEDLGKNNLVQAFNILLSNGQEVDNKQTEKSVGNEEIKKTALENGFKLKEQPNGSTDLNPYVYDFAINLVLNELGKVKDDLECHKPESYADVKWIVDSAIGRVYMGSKHNDKSPVSVGEHFDNFTKWANDRQIIQNGNILAQGLKLVSEVGELADNLAKGRCTKDDIGDCCVVLNNLAQMQGLTLEECLAQAWLDIKDRKGYMNEYGVFIKEGDTE